MGRVWQKDELDDEWPNGSERLVASSEKIRSLSGPVPVHTAVCGGQGSAAGPGKQAALVACGSRVQCGLDAHWAGDWHATSCLASA